MEKMLTFLSFVLLVLYGIKGHQVCYPPYGCFSDDAPFDEVFLPLPQPPQTIKTNFLLYTRSEPNVPTLLLDSDPNTIKYSGFSSTKRTVIVIHGYIEKDWTVDKTWLPALIETLLKKADTNVIDVDWQHGAHFPYHQADANARLVAAQLTYLMGILHTTAGMQYSNVYIIGFSLGAQIAGYVGSTIRKQGHMIDRITGLDLAAPYHEYKPVDARLDPTDASFVDVVHCDTRTRLVKNFGVDQRTGHVDFYVNDGLQPGCLKLGIDIIKNIVQYYICNHFRCPKYFVEAINSPCAFFGYECDNYSDFKKGLCTSCPPEGCRKMGYHADQNRSVAKKRLYLKTASTPPYCVYHYKITLYTRSELKARVKLILIGTNQSSKEISLGYRSLKAGGIEYYFTTSSLDPGSLRKVKIWHSEGSKAWYLKKVAIKESSTNTEYVGCYSRWWNSNRIEVNLNVKSAKITC